MPESIGIYRIVKYAALAIYGSPRYNALRTMRAQRFFFLVGSKGKRKLNYTYLVTGVLYGLVNVRTDGDRILCATLNEAKKTWDIKTFRSRF